MKSAQANIRRRKETIIHRALKKVAIIHTSKQAILILAGEIVKPKLFKNFKTLTIIAFALSALVLPQLAQAQPTVPPSGYLRSLATRFYPKAPPVPVDTTPPTAFTLTSSSGPPLASITTGVASPACAQDPTANVLNGGVRVTWTPSSDPESGVARHVVYLDGVQVASVAISAIDQAYQQATMASGGHVWRVDAVNGAGLITSATLNFRFDNAPPQGTVTAPVNGSTSTNAKPTITWTASDDNCVARIYVQIDGAPLYSSPIAAGTETSYTPTTALTAGAHTVRIHVVDGAGNGTFSATNSFTVQALAPAPTVTFTSGPAEGSTTAYYNQSVGYLVAGTTPTTTCSIDGAPSATCPASPVTMPASSGAHSLKVTATDAGGTTTATRAYMVSVDTTPPLDRGVIVGSPSPSNTADYYYAPVVNATPTPTNPLTLYINPAVNGGVNIQWNHSDYESGICSTTISAMGTGWSIAADQVFTASPCNDRNTGTSNLFSWFGVNQVVATGNKTTIVKNGAGLSTTLNMNVIADGVAPTAATVTPAHLSSVPSGSVVISWSGASDNLGVKNYDVLVDGITLLTKTTALTTTTSMAPGTHTIRVVTRDVVGNTSSVTNTVTAV